MSDTVFVYLNKDRKAEFKKKLKSQAKKAKDWVNRNQETLIVLTPFVIGSIASIARVIGKNANLRKEESIKNLYCYDRSLGHYWSLKRELTNNEWLEIDRRKKSGERIADILAEFRVLK